MVFGRSMFSLIVIIVLLNKTIGMPNVIFETIAVTEPARFEIWFTKEALFLSNEIKFAF